VKTTTSATFLKKVAAKTKTAAAVKTKTTTTKLRVILFSQVLATEICSNNTKAV